MTDIDVKMGDVVVTNNADNLIASGVGSCLAIILHDPKRGIGALGHTMLPRWTMNGDTRDTKYADTAIDEMLERMIALEATREDVEAKLVGGANMFPAFETDIGKENVLSAKEKLKKEGIKLVGESVGGSVGRSVEFSVASGVVTVKIKF